MKLINAVALLSFSSLLIQPAQSLNLPSPGFIKRGFKSCTDNCTTSKVCEDQKSLDWCVKNCSHKIDPLETKKMCTQVQWDKITTSIENNMGKLSAKEKQIYEEFMKRTNGEIPFVPDVKEPASAAAVEDAPPALPASDTPAQP